MGLKCLFVLLHADNPLQEVVDLPCPVTVKYPSLEGWIFFPKQGKK